MCDCHDLGDYKDLFRDEDVLYRRVLKQHVADGKVTIAHCQTKQWQEGLSCDWSIMATPEEAAKGLPYVLVFTVGQCKSLELDVRFYPHVDPHNTFHNLAHCLLVLPKPTSKSDIDKVRGQFLKVAVLRPISPELG